AQAGIAGKPGDPFIADYHDAEGRHVSARFEGLPAGFPADALRSGLEIATHLAVMVARRASLERERRLGTFLVELSRWLLAAPERTPGGVVGGVGVVRHLRPGGKEPPPFQLLELQYLTAVAAYIAGGLELSEAVSGARAAAERAHAMVDGSPLPMALVSRAG